ncbi:Lysophospholipase [Bertholletia excelsa]
MSFNSHGVGSGSRTSTRSFEFGRTHVVRPKGKHQATIVWLHGLGDKGSSWSQLFEILPLSNTDFNLSQILLKRLIFNSFRTHQNLASWFDGGDLSSIAPDDLEGLDASAAHIANLLSTEPADVKLGVGGFGMGAATALYSATCHVLEQYKNGSAYPIDLSAVVGLSGWLPCSRTLESQLEGSHEAARRAGYLPILLCHGLGDDEVPYNHGVRSAQTLTSAGFQNLTFRTYDGLGHYTIPEETDELCSWLTARLELEG